MPLIIGRLVMVMAANLVLPASVLADTTPDLVVRVSGSTLHVSFDLRSGEAPDVERRLGSARPVTVTWHIDVRRDVPLWVDRDRRRAEFTVRVRPQAPGRYAIERFLNGGMVGQPLSADRDDTIRHLTSFESLTLPGAVPRAAGTRHRVTIRAVVAGGEAGRVATPVLAEAMVRP